MCNVNTLDYQINVAYEIDVALGIWVKINKCSLVTFDLKCSKKIFEVIKYTFVTPKLFKFGNKIEKIRPYLCEIWFFGTKMKSLKLHYTKVEKINKLSLSNKSVALGKTLKI